MPFFIKTEIIKKEYLINHDLKQKIINEHIDWIKKLKKEGINIKSGFLVDELNRPGDGGLLILEMLRFCIIMSSPFSGFSSESSNSVVDGTYICVQRTKRYAHSFFSCN